jgi:hypothetical protein
VTFGCSDVFGFFLRRIARAAATATAARTTAWFGKWRVVVADGS